MEIKKKINDLVLLLMISFFFIGFPILFIRSFFIDSPEEKRKQREIIKENTCRTTCTDGYSPTDAIDCYIDCMGL